MNLRLRDTDALAVDLILDRAVAAQRGDGAAGSGPQVLFGSAASHARVSNEQVAAVHKVLSLLHVMHAPEPAQDLVRRTLERVSVGTTAPARGHGQVQIDHGRPVA